MKEDGQALQYLFVYYWILV